MQEVSHYLFRGSWGGGGGVGEGGRRVSPCAHLLIIHNCCKKYRIIYSEGVGEVVVVLGGGGGGGRERVRKATITGKLSIDLNNGVKLINHSVNSWNCP